MRKAASVLASLLALLAPCSALGAELPPGVGPIGEYERKTQSPMVWLRLRKTVLDSAAPSWQGGSFAEEAAQRLGELKSLAQSSE